MRNSCQPLPPPPSLRLVTFCRIRVLQRFSWATLSSCSWVIIRRSAAQLLDSLSIPQNLSCCEHCSLSASSMLLFSWFQSRGSLRFPAYLYTVPRVELTVPRLGADAPIAVALLFFVGDCDIPDGLLIPIYPQGSERICTRPSPFW